MTPNPNDRPALTRLADLSRKHHVDTNLLAALIAHEHLRISVAWHEAGHAVAGVLLGGRLRTAAVIEGTRNSNAISAPRGETKMDALPAGRRAAFAYAGPWAELRGTTGRRPRLYALLAALDYSSHATSDGAVLAMHGGTAAGDPVVPLLERCWPAVETVAQKLFKDNCVEHKDVVAALGLSADAETRSVELALIRSGSAPGTFTVTAAGR